MVGPPAPDTTAAAPDRPRTARRASVLPGPRSRFDQPRWVMARSLLLPGWGQIHNRAWLKAGLVIAGESWFSVRLIQGRNTLSRLEDQVAAAHATHDDALEERLVGEYNDELGRYVSRQWFMAGTLVYAVVDAYVDAHFRDFRIEFDADPALPGGRPSEGSARVSLRWRF